MLSITPTILSGFQIALEPIHENHREEMRSIAQDARIWTYLTADGRGDKFDLWFDKALNSFKTSQQLPFAVRSLLTQKIIGTTRYYDICLSYKRLTVGYTWYIPEVWGTYVNPVCKHLLLQHAFETLNLNRVEFCTDSRNLQSRSAIKKIGAIEEGTLRKHMIVENGYERDTVVFSIIRTDWPTVKVKLQERLKNLNKD